MTTNLGQQDSHEEKLFQAAVIIAGLFLLQFFLNWCEINYGY